MGRHSSPSGRRQPASTDTDAPIPFAELLSRHAAAPPHERRTLRRSEPSARLPAAFSAALAAAAVLAASAGVALVTVNERVAAHPISAGRAGPLGPDDRPRAPRISTTTPASVIRSTTSAPRSIPASARSTARPTPHAKRPKPLAGPRWTTPVVGAEFTSCFCTRWGKFHDGIDLAAPLGTPIHAPGAGTVVKVGSMDGYGQTVFIRHSNGDITFYGHMATVFVHVGQKVRTGQVIAPVGNEGFSTGPHLHFSVFRGGLTGPAIDPKPWLARRGIRVG